MNELFSEEKNRYYFSESQNRMFMVLDRREENDGSTTAILTKIGEDDHVHYCVANNVKLFGSNIGFDYIKPFDNLHNATVDFELQKYIPALRTVSQNKSVSR